MYLATSSGFFLFAGMLAMFMRAELARRHLRLGVGPPTRVEMVTAGRPQVRH